MEIEKKNKEGTIKKDIIFIDYREGYIENYLIISTIRNYNEKKNKWKEIFYCKNGYVVKRIIEDLL